MLVVRFAVDPKRVTVMPLYFKIPAYVGNSLLLGAGIILIFQQMFGMGVGLAALACFNLYLVRKLDVFSREEVWLESEWSRSAYGGIAEGSQ
jgi:hypothetical protein